MRIWAFPAEFVYERIPPPYFFDFMKSSLDITAWLPTTRKEMKQRAWDELDVVLISGDAYVDHPSFGVAVVGRTIAVCRATTMRRPESTPKNRRSTKGAI